MLDHDILYVDDEVEDLLLQARQAREQQRFVQLTPDDVQKDQSRARDVASKSNLWLFDFFNDDEKRRTPDLSQTATAANGVSLLQQFRLVVGDARPPSMVISNHLEEAVGPELNLSRRHVAAEELGVDWIAPKSGRVLREATAIADGFDILTRSSAQLAEDPRAYSANLATVILSLPADASWRNTAIRDVNHHRPPAWNKHSIRRSAREVISWLVRHVLPYPTFVINERHIAARLGISLDCVRAAIDAKTKLREALSSCRYRGVLSDFAGRRWWSAGVDALGMNIPTRAEDREAFLTAWVHPIPLTILEFDDPVVVSDADLVEQDELADASACVRAADEHFPPEVPHAWVRLESARRDAILLSKVLSDDLPRLDTSYDQN
jgi:hypothetical protein